MKKISILMLFITITTYINAQEKTTESATESKPTINRKVGLGIQSTFPTYGVSIKAAINDNSVLQGIIGPFSAGDFNMNVYGARYIYRFVSKPEQKVDPYLFVSFGVITFSYEIFRKEISDSFTSYGLGGGVEFIIGNAFGLALEAGYGKFGISDLSGTSSLFAGVGLHYYVK